MRGRFLHEGYKEVISKLVNSHGNVLINYTA